MTLSTGTRLGPYEIVAPLGAGGMGEVYRARDTRLGREVAVKVLSSALTVSEQARQRFEREARTISQLTHPHICALYDVGREGDAEYLVMELLEGQTLSDRIAKGPLPLDQALRFGAEIADALERAHRLGVVHRDLKPGNVMLTSSGVKLLDFGLARTLSTPGSDALLTALPTETPLTEAGTVLGTVQYMAPEQLEGKDADARTDIFALGIVLYEMATGKKAFSGATRASLIGAILRDDPGPISSAQPLSPRSLDRVVATCLSKEPEERWQTARDVALQLEGIRQERSAPGPPAPADRRPRRSSLLPWAIAAAAVALAVVGVATALRRAPPLPVLKTLLPSPPKTTYHVVGANIGGVALSPNGRRLAFGALDEDGGNRLWVRELDSLEPYPVPGADGALFPFWSPDSRSIGFFARGKLKVVEASPSATNPRELADVVEVRGGAWGEDGTIVYSPQSGSGLMRVPAGGGTPAPATQLDRATGEISHRWPYFLPGGRRFLYEVRRPDPKVPLEVSNSVFVASLGGKERRLVLSKEVGATRTVYAKPGYLLFRRGNNLMAARFDLKNLTVGEPSVLADNVQGFLATGSSIFSVSDDLLVYSPRVDTTPTKLSWLDRSGHEIATFAQPGRFLTMALSADARAAVVTIGAEPLPPDVWLFDTAAGRGLRLTRDAIPQVSPVLSPDGQRIFYSAYFTGPWDIWEIATQGAREPKPFLQTPTTKTVNDVSPDGRYLLYREFNAGTRGDLKYVPLTGERTPRTFIATADDETNATFSPDSAWVAYVSDESGRKEIYVASFPDPTRRVRVSADGGAQPRWSRDGKELFYVRSKQLVAVAVRKQGDGLAFGDGKELFAISLYSVIDPGFDMVTRYDVAPDGRFLALVRPVNEPSTPLVVVQNWAALLEKPR